MFSVFAGSELVGHTALENGDAPMGVAFGVFLPCEGYSRIREVCQKNHADQSGLQLATMRAGGSVIPAIGVSVLDYSLMVDEPDAEIEVNLIGVEATLYGQLFPDHVRAYDRQFEWPAIGRATTLFGQ